MSNLLPNSIYSGISKGGHVQGIAIDTKRGYVYYSFTTELIKTDLQGKLLGSVVNLIGHLGCIAYDGEENKLYGSLELKHDGIGKGIVNLTGKDLAEEDSFYIVSFDVEKIDRLNVDAEQSHVMKAVYLKDVYDDYSSVDCVSGKPHRYGCSGIDGISIGPEFGSDSRVRDKIVVTYGIYRDNERSDNDYQVLLQFDKKEIGSYALPLVQSKPHHNGPPSCEKRYFFLTGNTTFGVQNLEYDSFSGYWFLAVYTGIKSTYRNFNMYFIDGNVAPKSSVLMGRGNEVGQVLTSAPIGECDVFDIRGSYFPFGSTGMISLGNGSFYFSENGADKSRGEFYSNVNKYRYTPDSTLVFEKEV